MSIIQIIDLAAMADAAALQTAINTEIATQKAAGLVLASPPECSQWQDTGKDVGRYLLLKFSSDGSTAVALSPTAVVYDYPELDSLEVDLQAQIDAVEDGSLSLLGLPLQAIVGRGPSNDRVAVLLFGKSPAAEVIDLRAMLNNQYLASLSAAQILTEDAGGSTIASYGFDIAAANFVFDGIGGGSSIPAALDGAAQKLVGWDGFFAAVDGSAGVAITADGQTYYLILIAINVAGTPRWVVLHGAEAADASEAMPTREAMIAALKVAFPTATSGVFLDIVKLQRVAVDTITETVSSGILAVLEQQVAAWQNLGAGGFALA